MDTQPVNGHESASATRATSLDLRMLSSVLLDRLNWARQAGFAFGTARDYYAVLGYPRQLTVKEFRDEYARGGIAKRIVEAYPKATWRGGVELFEDEDPEKKTPFEAAWVEHLENRLRVWSVLQRADILAGLSTYSVILIGAPGDIDTELPQGSPEKLLYLTPFIGGGGPGVQNQQAASSNVDATIATFDENPQSPRFGLPLTYRLRRVDVNAPLNLKDAHWSRVVHIAEGVLDNPVYGIPVLEGIWNLLMDLLKVTGGGAEAFWLRAHQGLNLNLQKGAELDPPAKAALAAEVEQYIHGISRVMKTREMDVNTLGSDVANFSNPADAILTQIAGSKGIPKRILMGSEMGQLASGQDADNWATQVQDRRTGYAGPDIVRPLVDRLIEYGYLPKPMQYEVGWPTIESLTETEKAAGASSWATVNVSLKNAGMGPACTEAEIREKWLGLKPLTAAQLKEIADKKAEAVAQAQAAMQPEPEPKANDENAFPRAAQAHEDEMVRVLEAAIVAGNADVIDRIVGVRRQESASEPVSVTIHQPAPQSALRVARAVTSKRVEYDAQGRVARIIHEQLPIEETA